MAKKKPKGYYRRGDRWQVDTSYKGIRIRQLVATPEMAEKVIRNEQTAIDKECHLGIKRQAKVRLGQFAERYLKWCRQEGQKAIDDKCNRLRRVVEFIGEDLMLGELKAEHIEGFKQHRLSKRGGERKKVIKPATVNRELASIQHMLTKAVDWGLIAAHPGKSVKSLKESNRSLRYLTAEELQRLTEGASPYLKPLIVVAANTGLRRGELFSLRWSQIDFRTGHIELTDQKNGEHSHLPLNKAAKAALRKVPRRIGSPLVFSKANGIPPVDFKRHFAKALEAAGIENFRFHDIRHTFASHLAMSGVDLLTIKELMRHKTMAMTLRYAHLSSQHTKKAVEQLSFETSPNEQKKAL